MECPDLRSLRVQIVRDKVEAVSPDLQAERICPLCCKIMRKTQHVGVAPDAGGGIEGCREISGRDRVQRLKGREVSPG